MQNDFPHSAVRRRAIPVHAFHRNMDNKPFIRSHLHQLFAVGLRTPSGTEDNLHTWVQLLISNTDDQRHYGNASQITENC